jgi:hypothetical protein
MRRRIYDPGDWLEQKAFTTFVHRRQHENFDLLDRYPTTQWARLRRFSIREHIIMLMRGRRF